MRIGILEPDRFSAFALHKLRQYGSVSFFKGKGKKDIERFIHNKHILFIRLHYYIGGKMLKYCGRLKYLCTPTTGLNHIDVSGLKKLRVKILSLKGEKKFLSSIRATPEHTFGLILALLRNYKSAFLRRNNFNWNRDKYIGCELFGNTVGIIGFGRVGTILAKYLKAFSSQVLFYDCKSIIGNNYGAQRVHTLDELIIKSNIIILCASYTNSNNRFIGKRYLNLMKNKFFINTSRGELVDEDYLLFKIKQKWFKGAAIDVISNEVCDNNLKKIKQLLNHKNFIVTPHIGGATYSSMHKTEEFLVEKLGNHIVAEGTP